MANTYKRIAFTSISGGGADSFEVKVTVFDTNPQFLDDKIQVSNNAVNRLTKTVLKNPSTGEESISLEVDETQIDHDVLQNFNEAEHRLQDDNQTTTTTLWSSQKTQDELDTKVDKVSSTDNAVPKFNGVDGNIQDSGIIIDDSNNVTGVNNLTIEGDLTVKGETTSLEVTTLDVEDTNITLNKGGNDLSSQGSGITVERTGVDGSIIYDSAVSSKFKAGDVGLESEILTKDATQDVLNKTIDGTAATGTNTVLLNAEDIPYDDTNAQLGVGDVQQAIDILDSTVDSNSIDVFNNSQSIIELDGRVTSTEQNIDTLVQELSDHIDSTVDAHDASAISFDNSINGFTATNAQEAIEEAKNEVGSSVQEIYDVTNEPTGFPNRTDSIVTFDDITYSLTIAPTGASFDIYIKGKKFNKTNAESIALNNVLSGNHYFYYDNTGTLQVSNSFFPEIFSENAIVAVVYWNTDLQAHVYFAEERHGLQMDGATHGYLHTTFGARYISGLALQNFDEALFIPGFDVDSGSIRDEDLLLQINTSTVSQLGIMYRQGTQWKKLTNQIYPLIEIGATSDYPGTVGRMPYNKFDELTQTWSLQDPGSDNTFVLVHYFATNDKDTPIVAIQGTGFYGDSPSAKNAAAEEIRLLSGLPFLEFVAIGTVVYRTSASFARPFAKYVPIDPGVNYVDFRGTQQYTPSGTATSHSILSGLSNDDHTQYLNDDRFLQKFPYDIFETEYTLLDNQSTFTVISGLIIDTNSYSFTAYINVERGDLSEFVVLRSNYSNQISDWNTTIESTGFYTGIDFRVANDNIEYKSSNTGDNAIIRIKIEGLGTAGV